MLAAVGGATKRQLSGDAKDYALKLDVPDAIVELCGGEGEKGCLAIG